MKIMISLKTYSSLPLTAAEEKEEEEFSVKARYNAEREREKNAGGSPSITASATAQLQRRPLEIGEEWIELSSTAKGETMRPTRCTEMEG